MLENGGNHRGSRPHLAELQTEEGMRLGAKKAKEGASVRELEALAKRLNEEKEGPVKSSPEKPVLRGKPSWRWGSTSTGR